MKEFTKNAYINSECLKNNEIIKFESHYLRIKENPFCDNCFFKKKIKTMTVIKRYIVKERMEV